MFSTSKPIDVTFPGPDGDKKAAVRFPNDDEWCERFRRRKTVVKTLGRGNTESTVVGREEADLALYEKIKIDGSAELDGYEASALIEQVSTADVINVERVGNAYTVELRLVGDDDLDTAKITLRTPSQKEMRLCNDSSVRVFSGKFGMQEIRVVLNPSKELFDKLFESAEGYESNTKEYIPIIHKYKVVDAVSTAINEFRELSGKKENF